MAKKRCPFNKSLNCDDCRLFRRGIRLVGLEEKQEEIAECAFHLIVDEMEQVHTRVLALQKEVGETKNANVYQAMAMMGNPAGVKELFKMIKKHFPEAAKLEG